MQVKQPFISGMPNCCLPAARLALWQTPTNQPQIHTPALATSAERGEQGPDAPGVEVRSGAAGQVRYSICSYLGNAVLVWS